MTIKEENYQILENQSIYFSSLLRFKGKIINKQNIELQARIQETIKLNNVDKPSNETIIATIDDTTLANKKDGQKKKFKSRNVSRRIYHNRKSNNNV